MIGEINEKLMGDEDLSTDPFVMLSLVPNFINSFEIVKNEIESERKKMKALLKKKNQLMDEKDAGPGSKK